MNIRKSILLFSLSIILFFAVQSCLLACPYCNQQFYNELLGKRANTLGGEELLEAIRNQSVSGEDLSFTLPSSVNPLTDIQQANTQDTLKITETIGTNKEKSFTSSEYLPLTIMFARLIFFGHFIT